MVFFMVPSICAPTLITVKKRGVTVTPFWGVNTLCEYGTIGVLTNCREYLTPSWCQEYTPSKFFTVKLLLPKIPLQ